MGFFNTLKDTIDETKRVGELKKVIYRKELEADPKRPSIKNLPFKVLNPSVANDPRLMEPKKVNKANYGSNNPNKRPIGTKNKFVKK